MKLDLTQYLARAIRAENAVPEFPTLDEMTPVKNATLL
jgi:hypothetical protein